MTACAKRFAFLVLSMTLHARHIFAIMQVVMRILPLLIVGSSGGFNQFFTIVAIHADEVTWKGFRLRILMTGIAGLILV